MDYAITTVWGLCVVGAGLFFSGWKTGAEPELDFFSSIFFGAIAGTIFFFVVVLPAGATLFGLT